MFHVTILQLVLTIYSYTVYFAISKLYIETKINIIV